MNFQAHRNRSPKEDRKLKRRIQKSLISLRDDWPKPKLTYPEYQTRSQDEPFLLCETSKIVFITNGGLTTGADDVTIMEFFISSGFDGIEEIIMIPGKQYSFVIFNDQSDAATAVMALAGVKSLPGSTHPLYLACINRVPPAKWEVKKEKPPGLFLVEDFISAIEEEMLLALIDWKEQPCIGEGSTLKHRQVRHFGYEFSYSSNSVDKSTPLSQKIPHQLEPICQRLIDKRLMEDFPDQLTVNRYLPGQGIPSHIDTHSSFSDKIASLSVGGSVIMDFRCECPNSCQKDHREVFLPRRSICVMTGPSRYQWTHGICPRKTDVISSAHEPKTLILTPRGERISYTFRKIRDGKCECPYPSKCDSQQYGKKREGMNKTTTAWQLEKDHVIGVYEQIAQHFSHTRHKQWPRVRQFIENVPAGSFMLDVGCGNGKYMGFRDIFQVGCDTSEKLLSICGTKGLECAFGNCIYLPFRDESFDAIICIAVIHHLASKERRKRAVVEIARVLRRGGSALIYVWAMEQRKGDKSSSYLRQKLPKSSHHAQTEYTQANSLLHHSPDASENEINYVEHRNMPFDEAVLDLSEISSDKISLDKLSVHENGTNFAGQDMFVPWKVKPEQFRPSNKFSSVEHLSTDHIPVFHRYFHVFREHELEKLVMSCSSVEITSSYYDEGNWCVEIRKV